MGSGLLLTPEVVFDMKEGGGSVSGGNVQVDEKGDVSTDRRNQLLDFVAEELEIKDKKENK